MKKVQLGLVALTVAIAGVTVTVNAADEKRRPASEALKNYFSAWNEPDEAKRTAMLEECWADAGTYTDPTAHVEGRAALATHIAGFLSSPQFKGYSIIQTSGIDEHHDVFRFEWEMRDGEGKSLTKGMDYGEIDADGKITKIVGFFGPFPAMK